MTKIAFGSQHGKSRSEYKIATDGKSNSEITVGDQYDESERSATILDFQDLSPSDMANLAGELARLKSAIQADSGSSESKIVAAQVATAEAAARSGDPNKTRQHLAEAGKRALDVATKIAVPLAIAALKSALGLGG